MTLLRMRDLPRRKRQIVWTTVGAVVFVAAAAIVARALAAPADTYTPGGEVEGLTSTLARELPEDAVVVVQETDARRIGEVGDPEGSRSSERRMEDRRARTGTWRAGTFVLEVSSGKGATRTVVRWTAPSRPPSRTRTPLPITARRRIIIIIIIITGAVGIPTRLTCAG